MNRLKIKIGKVFLREDRIVQCDISEKIEEIGAAHIKEALEAVCKLKASKVPLLLKETVPHSISHEAQVEIANTKIVNAMAILAFSSVAATVTSHLVSISKTPYPFRVFGREEAAVKWLKLYLS